MTGLPLRSCDTPTAFHGIAWPNALRVASFAAKKPASRSGQLRLRIAYAISSSVYTLRANRARSASPKL